MAYKRIIIKGEGVRNERVANAAITPGMLVELMSTGKVRAHANAGQPAQKSFAVEDDLQGNAISDAYAADALVQYDIMRPGDVVYAFLKNGENAVIGSLLESAGNGELQVYTADSAGIVEYPNSIVGQAIEAVDMSDSSAADPAGRILVEIL